MRRVRIRTIAGLVLAVALVSNGCANTESGTTTLSVPTSTTGTTHGPVGTAAPFVPVEVAVSPDGRYLVDADGRSLYLFTLDDARTSSCEGACAEAWPPLLGDPQPAEGVEPGLLGKAERANGSVQVTYNGWPLYLYTGDAEPGDTTGHGFNDVWFLVAPDGTGLES